MIAPTEIVATPTVFHLLSPELESESGFFASGGVSPEGSKGPAVAFGVDRTEEDREGKGGTVPITVFEFTAGLVAAAEENNPVTCPPGTTAGPEAVGLGNPRMSIPGVTVGEVGAPKG